MSNLCILWHTKRMPDFVSSPANFCYLLLSFAGYFDVFPNGKWKCQALKCISLALPRNQALRFKLKNIHIQTFTIWYHLVPVHISHLSQGPICQVLRRSRRQTLMWNWNKFMIYFWFLYFKTALMYSGKGGYAFLQLSCMIFMWTVDYL